MNLGVSGWEGLKQIYLVQDNVVAGFCEHGNEPSCCTHNFLTVFATVSFWRFLLHEVTCNILIE
jgi:hypothetical protein